MQTIKDTFQTLTDKQKALLNYAFQHGISQFVEYAEARFIGVNTEHISNLVVEQKAGVWNVGQIKKSKG